MKENYINKVENNNWLSKKELMEICKCGKTTIEQIINDLNSTTSRAIQSHIKKSGYHNLEVFYDDYLVKLIQTKLKQNAMNAGGQRTEGSVIKQDNQQDLFIGCVATKGTPAEKRSLAEHLMVMADQQELLEQTKQHNQQLLIENHNLSEENNYLKKLTDFQSTQIGYYTKKYHSWYDDYENY